MTRAEHNKRKGRSSSQLLRPEKRQRIYARDGWRCVWCKRHASESGVKLTIDHFMPRALGGDNATENMLTACSRCNSERQDRPAIGWLIVRTATLREAGRELARIADRRTRPLPRFVP